MKNITTICLITDLNQIFIRADNHKMIKIKTTECKRGMGRNKVPLYAKSKNLNIGFAYFYEPQELAVLFKSFLRQFEQYQCSYSTLDSTIVRNMKSKPPR